MRVLLIVLVLGLALCAPQAAAEETTAPAASSSTSSSETKSTDVGPEPTSCRPYCFAE